MFSWSCDSDSDAAQIEDVKLKQKSSLGFKSVFSLCSKDWNIYNIILVIGHKNNANIAAILVYSFQYPLFSEEL